MEILPHPHPPTPDFSNKYLSHKIKALWERYIWHSPHVTDGTLRGPERRDWTRVIKARVRTQIHLPVVGHLKPREKCGEAVKG